MRRFAILAAVMTALLVSCTESVPLLPDDGSEREEPVFLTEEELLTVIAEKTPLVMETHVYADLDYDGGAELLLVTGQEGGTFDTWFCSSDGSVCEKIRTTEDAWDTVSVSSIGQNDGMHVFCSYHLAMGTAAHTDIFRLDGGYPTLVAESVHSIWCEDDSVILLREDYDMTYDPTLDTTIGHTYKTTELMYDDGEYYEFSAIEVPLDEVRAMQNSDVIFGQIDADGNEPCKAYLRGNGTGYVECGDLDADRARGTEGTYCYYTFSYEEDTVCGLIKGTLGTYDNAGRMTDHFGDFPVRAG